MLNPKRVILVSDNIYYRVGTLNPVTGMVTGYGKWSDSKALIEQWCNVHQNTFVDETLNISSLGGYTLEEKHAEMALVNDRIYAAALPELRENLEKQREKLTADIAVLRMYGGEIIKDDIELDLIGSFDHPVIKHSKRATQLEEIRNKIENLEWVKRRE